MIDSIIKLGDIYAEPPVKTMGGEAA
jgi:hypothetical protein